MVVKTDLAPRLIAAENRLLEVSLGDRRQSIRSRAMVLGLLTLARERGGLELEELVRNELT
jgi:hypothetical protein